VLSTSNETLTPDDARRVAVNFRQASCDVALIHINVLSAILNEMQR